MKAALALVVLAGCASGGSATSDGSLGGPPDAQDFLDAAPVRDTSPPPDTARPDAPPDAAPPDAALPDAALPDAPIPDAPMVDAAMPDAPVDACVPVTTELLVNPALDLTPRGTGWHETPIDAAYPIITNDGQYAAQSAPYKAWMGGITGDDEGTSSVTDVLYQDVTVPAGTTQLVLTGYYTVGTNETTTTTVYDHASVDLTQTNGTPIENVMAPTNLTTSAQAWTAFSHAFTANLAGQTVRLRFTSTNDITNYTNFFFDTLSLKATYCP